MSSVHNNFESGPNIPMVLWQSFDNPILVVKAHRDELVDLCRFIFVEDSDLEVDSISCYIVSKIIKQLISIFKLPQLLGDTESS